MTASEHITFDGPEFTPDEVVRQRNRLEDLLRRGDDDGARAAQQEWSARCDELAERKSAWWAKMWRFVAAIREIEIAEQPDGERNQMLIQAAVARGVEVPAIHGEGDMNRQAACWKFCDIHLRNLRGIDPRGEWLFYWLQRFEPHFQALPTTAIRNKAEGLKVSQAGHLLENLASEVGLDWNREKTKASRKAKKMLK